MDPTHSITFRSWLWHLYHTMFRLPLHIELACINIGTWTPAYNNNAYTTETACTSVGTWNSTGDTCSVNSGGREVSQSTCTDPAGAWTPDACSITSGGREASQVLCEAAKGTWSGAVSGVQAGFTFTTQDKTKAGIVKEDTSGPLLKYIMTKGEHLAEMKILFLKQVQLVRRVIQIIVSNGLDSLTMEISTPDGTFVDAKADKDTILKIQNTFDTSGYPGAAARDRKAQFIIENSVASGSKTAFTQEVCGGSPGGVSCGVRGDKWSLRSQFGGSSLNDNADRIRVAADSSAVSRTITQCVVASSGTVATMTTNSATDLLAVGDLVTISGMAATNTITITNIAVSNSGKAIVTLQIQVL